ncbi:unnamed protein product [Lactuca virosa]|uniref:CMP/dCMP-type deaminase domain-containing protein n=1 Tax=Lactuca virosa TaxID=75947 RepID=A0AAU9LPW1_9ASTR|nr:unnamed protein product [Lactuca virosa]
MMHTTCLNSAVSLRCGVSPSSLFTDPTYYLDARFDSNPLLISSSFSSSCCCCCCCCASNSNLIYNRLPRINPRYLCNGLRQSTLIQFSPSKRLTFHGSRRQSCNTTFGFSSLTDSDRNYYYEKLYSFKEKRKLGKGRCWGIEDKKKTQSFSNAIEDDCLNEVEMLLDLLTEEVGLESIGVRERKRTNKKDHHHETKIVSSGAVKRDLKHDNKAVKIQCMEEENRRLINKKREEERETFVKKKNHERKKEGSSCSSYYSVSSTGEFDSDNDVEIKHDVGESSSDYKDDQRIDSYKSYDEENVERRHEILKKKNSAESYYGNEEWRKKSEKKLNVESSQQQSQVSISQHGGKANRITDQSQSRMKYERLMESSETDNKMELNSNMQNKLNTSSVQNVTQKDEYRKQSNVISESSGVHQINMKKASSSSSSSSSSSMLEARIKNQEHNSTQVSSQIEEKQERINQMISLQESRLKSQQISRISDTQIAKTENSSISHMQSESRNEKQELHLDTSRTTDRREEKQERIDQMTSLQESRVKSQQISRISDTQIAKTENSSISHMQSNIRNEKQQVHLNTSRTDRREEKQERIDQMTSLQQQISRISDTQIAKTENSSVSHTQSEIRSEKQELHLDASRTTEKVTMAEKLDLRRKKNSSSRVELMEGTSESMKTGKKTTKASSFNIGMESSTTYKALKLNPETEINLQESGAQLSEHFETINESSRIHQSDVIASADEEHKSSSHFLGEFVKNANSKLTTSQNQQEEKTHEQDLVYEDDDDKRDDNNNNNNTSGESLKKNGRSLWNVIGDVIRFRWSSETHISKASSIQSNSEAWFSGHEHENEDSNDENVKTGITKSRSRSRSRSRRRTDDSPLLLLSSSSNPNQESSSKTMSPPPSVIEESSFPVPAIRMRRSPVVKRSGSSDTDASGSGKMVNTTEISPASSSGKMVNMTETSPGSSSGKMVIVDEPILSTGELKQRKLARIDQVSKDRFDEWEEAYDIETKQRKIDEFFMKEAILEAKKGADFWEVPVGAVLVHDGKIIARGYNLVEELRDSTAHAEMICIREGSNNLRSWRLSVTHFVCVWCATAS